MKETKHTIKEVEKYKKENKKSIFKIILSSILFYGSEFLLFTHIINYINSKEIYNLIVSILCGLSLPFCANLFVDNISNNFQIRKKYKNK